jgi:chromosomal replication initiation ATPase DnaA
MRQEVEQIGERIRAEGEIEVPGPRAKFSELLPLTANAFDMKERDLVEAGRQRKWVRARSMLVYLAREWGRASVKEIGQRLHRDSSIISRLYLAYTADRDRKTETLLAKQLQQ